MKEKTKILLLSGLISFLLLLIFLIMQYYDFKVLKLDVKWLIVSGLPILIGMFLSGIIKSFKGFGVELEANLSEKIEINLIRTVESYPSPEITKSSLGVLHDLPLKKKKEIKRLQFIYGKKEYYDTNVINEYLRNLTELKYIEIIDDTGKFIALLPAKVIKHNDNSIYEKLRLFIKSIENRNIHYYFKEMITDTINKDDSLIQAYKKFKDSKQGKLPYGDQILPVIDNNFRMIGLTRRLKLADKISEQVVKVKK